MGAYIEVKMVSVQGITIGRNHDAEDAAGLTRHLMQEYSLWPVASPVAQDRNPCAVFQFEAYEIDCATKRMLGHSFWVVTPNAPAVIAPGVHHLAYPPAEMLLRGWLDDLCFELP
jgi:hypothetical protein